MKHHAPKSHGQGYKVVKIDIWLCFKPTKKNMHIK